MAFYRYQEKKADNNIADSIDLLNGMKSLLSDHEQIIIKNHEHMPPIYSKYHRWINNFGEIHPSPTNRIKKLDQRIALLEKKSLNTQNNNVQ